MNNSARQEVHEQTQTTFGCKGDYPILRGSSTAFQGQVRFGYYETHLVFTFTHQLYDIRPQGVFVLLKKVLNLSNLIDKKQKITYLYSLTASLS